MSTATAPPTQPKQQNAKAEPKVFRFRVHAGGHFHPMPVLDDEGNQIVRDGKPFMQDVIFGPGRPAGDIVVTNVRLDKLHNTGNFKKFELLDQNNNPLVTQLQETEQQRDSANERFRKALGKMTQRELLDYATAEGIDLKGELADAKVRDLILIASGLKPNDPKEERRAAQQNRRTDE